MKVGILTFHDASNYGAALQALATQQVLQRNGCDCFMINYSNDFRGKIYEPSSRVMNAISRRKMLGVAKAFGSLPGIYLRNWRFASFRRKYFRETPRVRGHDRLREVSEVFDAVLIGSDQVWSPKNNGADLAYYGGVFSSGARLVSYASSLGAQQLPDELAAGAASALARFSHLSTREEGAARYFRDKLGLRCQTVLDPVLLLSSEDWINLLELQLIERKGPYAVVYVNDAKFLKTKEFEELSATFEDVRIYGSFSLSQLLSPQFSLNNAAGPREFLRDVAQASLVYTTSYHALLFSIIFERDFSVFLTGDDGRDSRIKHIAETVPTLIRRQTEEGYSVISSSPQSSLDRYDALDSLRKSSLNFIKTALHVKAQDTRLQNDS